MPLLQALPDISVRFAVASFGASGALSFGPAKITAEGSTYRAVLDYVNVDAVPVNFFLRQIVAGSDGIGWNRVLAPEDPNNPIVGYEAILESETVSRDSLLDNNYDFVTIPIYVGVGMRLSADIRAFESGIALTSLGSIAAEAQTNALSGTLTVQTLGITGRSVATALPLPSKLDQTTVENGILALGSTRAILYHGGDGTDDVQTTPRVVGLYSPVGSDPRLINAIYSALASNEGDWAWEGTCRATQ